MVAMSLLFGVILALMVLAGVSVGRRGRPDLTELGAQERQALVRSVPGGPAEITSPDHRPHRVSRGEHAALLTPG